MQRRIGRAGFVAAFVCAGVVRAAAPEGGPVPAGDFHQHVFSESIIALIGADAGLKSMGARELVSLLDEAGVQKATLLSTAYMYGRPSRQVDGELAKVRAENDWTAAQAALYPRRLVALCGVNPLKDYALEELERCARNSRTVPGFGRGIKLHLGNSDVRLDEPADVARLRAFFAAANARGMALVVHLRANIGKKRPYGAREARVFLEQVLPAAPDVAVQVAHFAGSGPGYDDPPAREAMAVLAEAAGRGAPGTARLVFDVASIVTRDTPPETLRLVADLVRQAGAGRVLYGSDSAQGDNLRPREGWQAFRRLPLTQAQFAQIASNVPAYFPGAAATVPSGRPAGGGGRVGAKAGRGDDDY